MSDARAAGAVTAYTAGATTREVAALVGVHPSTVARWVAGVGGLRRAGPRGHHRVPTALIVELRDGEGLAFAAVAALVGMSKTGVIHRYRIAVEGRRRDRGAGMGSS